MTSDVRRAKNWNGLVRHLESIKRDHESITQSKSPRYVSDLLFRGHADSRWTLKTTLDREVGDMLLVRYYRMVYRSLPQLEVFTGRRWNLPIPPEYEDRLRGAEAEHQLFGNEDLEVYRFLVYMRHHGFPSPLLDWTRSMYIAMYFAFASETSADSVAIYAYVGDTGRPQAHWVGAPHIVQRGQYVTAHPRHFLQQAEYTTCTRNENDRWLYTDHEQVFSVPNRQENKLWKVIAPSSIRPIVLKRLDEMNINAFSLFQTEDSLMEAAKVREFVFS